MKNLIPKLINQHKNLRKELGRVQSEITAGPIDFLELNADLVNFKKLFETHLKLENGVFYPRLIEKFRGRKIETGYIEKFKREMQTFEQEVTAFLRRYDEPAKIESGIDRFKPEFNFMVSSMMMRITSEEDSVFLYW